MAGINKYIETWKEKLLDLGKRNRLIKYRETKRSSIRIISPDYEKLFEQIVNREKSLAFPFVVNGDEVEDETGQMTLINEKNGDLTTSQTTVELQKTLRNIRYKAKTALEEQGVNILYLSFGFLEWKDLAKNESLRSPLILIPAKLTIESIASPYKLSMYEDEIVVNPTLAFKLREEYGLTLPSFTNDEESLSMYFDKLNEIFLQNGWKVDREVGLSLLSFLKINMYEDLDKNTEKLLENPILRALAGDPSGIVEPSEEFQSFDHDANTEPQKIFQVLDADSSQLDAILYAKKKVSFVLQGPPGTGKSQTITNIIAESLAEGKKVLFVSEKSAALEVVYKRLEQTHLSDFCLAMHSHKANKKDVLAELGRTLSLEKVRIRDEALTKLKQLEMKKKSINRYIKELHEPCKPMNASFYDIYGKLAKLHDVPTVDFNLMDVEKATRETLDHYLNLLGEFARTIGVMTEGFSSNPWYGCNVESLTYAFRNTVESKLSKLIPNLKVLEDHSAAVITEYDLNLFSNYKTMEELTMLLDLFSRSPKVPVEWIYCQDLVDLTNEAQTYKALQCEYFNVKQNMIKSYTENVFLVAAKEINSQYEEQMIQAEEILSKESYNSRDHIIDGLESIIGVLTMALGDANIIKSACTKVSPLFDVIKADSLYDAHRIYQLLPYMLSAVNPSEEWFFDQKYLAVKLLVKEAKENNEKLFDMRKRVLDGFEKDIFAIDANHMLRRFKAEYNSILKFFKKSYWEDKKQIVSYSKEVQKKMHDMKIVDTLTLIKHIHDIEAWFTENTKRLEVSIGKHYIGENTNWDRLESAMNSYDHIRDYFGMAGLDQATRKYLINPGPYEDQVQAAYQEIKGAFDTQIDKKLDYILGRDKAAANMPLDKLCEQIVDGVDELSKLSEVYEKMQSYASKRQSHQQIIADFKALAKMQDIAKKIEKQSIDLQETYQYLFKGTEKTDWNEILNRLNWTGEFRSANCKYQFTDSLIRSICTDNTIIKQAGEYLTNMKDLTKPTEDDMSWFIELFDENEAERILTTQMLSLIKRLEKCHNNFGALEKWVDYRLYREKCTNEGLADYVRLVEDLPLDDHQVIPVFKKRFYTLWVDAMMPTRPAIASFRGENHERNIVEFRELDKSQLKIASMRLRETLASKLPDMNSFISSSDEVGILRKELNKKRRIKPLRKLFQEIPNLLLKLKPCLMMSPLSVSLFLDANLYNFDIILFDEASQIRTEDAVGAIIRGSQIVIAGDTEQLPPTNFFAASTSDSAYDVDFQDEDEYSESDAYESILDEANPVLPETTLRWHYRSKHEDLIAFSNKHVYNNRLITFPSSMQDVKDYGVEYVHVADGLYDRSGQRDNRNEAVKVADLVFEHFEKHPKRSLGVVTFSEAQQLAVQTAIRKKRHQNQIYENFFDEECEESFFVKNLENVQGDERDTIFFSIGYAKDKNGIMHMNFGPLSKQGGHRRLNVAITRAKYNVKLIGSIMPTDIDLERTSAEGVKLLRSYIEYAVVGNKALHNELNLAKSVSTESPFEESVYDFIVARGYKVLTQVGCADYRIDMAIEHPSQAGRFVLGIECDGATYHSTRTARERDRIRQTVLEDMGWKIYRIWSTNWVKEPTDERKKLLDVIDNAINNYRDPINDLIESQENGMQDNEISKETDENQYVRVIQEELGKNGLPELFVNYKETNIDEVARHYDNEVYVGRVIDYIVGREYPIHEELLFKRIGPIFEQGKATKNVKEFVKRVAKYRLRDQVELIDEFYWRKDASKLYVRIASESGEQRNIKHISVEEIAQAIYEVARSSIGILEEDLKKETASILGFKRMGDNINEKLEQAMSHLIRTGRIKNTEGKITNA